MSIPVVLQGTLASDGTLQLDEKVNLPAGRVQVTLLPVPTAPGTPAQFRERMQAIWAARLAGMQTPTATQTATEQRQALREEMEQEIQEAMLLQERCRTARQGREPAP